MYTTEGRIGVSHTGADGRVRVVAAFDLMQDCSNFWYESEPGLAAYLRENGLAILLAYRQVDLLRRPAFGERIQIQTGIYSCKSYFGYRNTEITDAGGEPWARSWSLGAFVDLNTGALCRLPDAVTGEITLDERLDMAYTPKKVRPPEATGTRLDPVPVRRAEIDMFGHVNNAYHVERGLECLPEGLEVRRVRVEYKRPALLGDSLYPRRVQTAENTHFVALEDGEGRPYSLMEFTV